MAPERGLHGLMAEFGDPAAVVAAARRAREAGYRVMDAYTPYPIEELSEAMGWHTRGRLPKIVLAGGIIGCLSGAALQYWASAINFPLNIGGRPLNSWPSFIPICFELTVLVAALSAVFGMIFLNGLPMPYHPVFNVAEFALASRDRFFLCIEAKDPRFDPKDTKRFLESLGPAGVYDVAD